MRLAWSKNSAIPPSELPSAEEMKRHEHGVLSAEVALYQEDALPDVDESRASERASLAEIEFMNRAGSRCADVVMRQRGLRKVVVFCGAGNNGGDGLVLARYLTSWGRNVEVVLASCSRYSESCLVQLQSFLETAPHKIKIAFNHSDQESTPISQLKVITSKEIEGLCDSADCIVDALLGIGQSGEPREHVAKLVNLINSAQKRVYALDTPTGLDSSTGAVAACCVRASDTLCIEYLKRGLLQYPARDYAGELHCIPVGLGGIAECAYRILDEKVYANLKTRRPDSHKGTYGHVLVVGGSRETPGAAVLSAEAALLSGAGKVTFTSHLRGVQPTFSPDLMQYPIKAGFSEDTAAELEEFIRGVNSVVVGPGLGTGDATQGFLRRFLDILAGSGTPHVIDADALNYIAHESERFSRLRISSAVLTPHPGEAARILHQKTAEVQANRFISAERIFERLGALVVLKGAASLVWDGTSGWINTSGTYHLATAGSGDILTGIIGAFLGQGLTLSEAARTAVFIHGRLGDEYAKLSSAPATASRLLSLLPQVLSRG